MRDKCLRNELMDVTCINNPDLFSNLKKNEVYIYAEYLKPGYHQLLIFDPLLEKAYCKDFMVNLNLRDDLYPEYPVIDGFVVKPRVKNVFEEWREDRQEDKIKAFQVDMSISENFYTGRLVKDTSDQNIVIKTMLENFDYIKVYHKHLLVGSAKYP